MRGEPVFLVPAKPERGARVLAKEKDDAKREAAEVEIRKAVRKRDGGRCRIAIPHKCRGPLECAHVVDASLGGEYEAANLVLCCRWIHRQGAISVHQKRVEMEPQTARGADGPLGFYRREGEERWLVVREVRIHQLERD